MQRWESLKNVAKEDRRQKKLKDKQILQRGKIKRQTDTFKYLQISRGV